MCFCKARYLSVSPYTTRPGNSRSTVRMACTCTEARGTRHAGAPAMRRRLSESTPFSQLALASTPENKGAMTAHPLEGVTARLDDRVRHVGAGHPA